MEKIVYDSQFFNISDTLTCGQTFRFIPYEKGFKVFSADKCAYVYADGVNTVIECETEDKDYFYDYFDLARDYGSIVNAAQNTNIEILRAASEVGKGIRLLNQDITEVAFSFMISQNNNIPRIKSIIEKICFELGEKKSFLDGEYFTFPTAEKLSEKDVDFYVGLGLGYRAEYVKRLADDVVSGLDFNSFKTFDTHTLKARLKSIHGIGQKVADCICLFGFKRSDSFPVDTWIEKVYKEDLKGTEINREKIAEELVLKFKDNAGYFQQYVFYYKRSIETRNKNQKFHKK